MDFYHYFALSEMETTNYHDIAMKLAPLFEAMAHTENSHLVTFMDLGSVRCIPCQKMQPVMKSIEEKYAIEVIPTQAFLDKDGKEFFRHQGFFEETELIKVLDTKGVQL